MLQSSSYQHCRDVNSNSSERWNASLFEPPAETSIPVRFALGPLGVCTNPSGLVESSSSVQASVSRNVLCVEPHVITPYLKVRELRVLASLDKATRSNYTSAGGKILATCVTIDEFEEDGVQILILANLDITRLEQVNVVGAASDLVHVLNYMAGRAGGFDWHVKDLCIIEEETDDANPADETLYARAVVNFVQAIACNMAAQSLKIHLVTRISDDFFLRDVVTGLGWSQSLVQLDINFPPIGQLTSQYLQAQGWQHHPGSLGLVRPSQNPLPADVYREALRLSASLARSQQAIQNRVMQRGVLSSNLEDIRTLLSQIGGLVDALAEGTRGTSDDEDELKELDEELALILGRSEPTSEVMRILHDMFR